MAEGDSLVCNVACTRYLFALLPQLYHDMRNTEKMHSLRDRGLLIQFEAVHSLTLEFDENEDLHDVSLDLFWLVFKQVQTLTLVGGRFGHVEYQEPSASASSSALVDAVDGDSSMDAVDAIEAKDANTEQKLQASLRQHFGVKSRLSSRKKMVFPDHVPHIVLRCQTYNSPPWFSSQMRSLLVICDDITDLRVAAHSLEILAARSHDAALHTIRLRLSDKSGSMTSVYSLYLDLT